MTTIEFLKNKLHEVLTKKGYPDCGAYDGGFLDGYAEAVYDVEHHSEWAPASEPPKEDGEYIVCIEGATEATALYYDQEKDAWYEDVDDERDYYKVVAWQPFPEVYKGE